VNSARCREWRRLVWQRSPLAQALRSHGSPICCDGVRCCANHGALHLLSLTRRACYTDKLIVGLTHCCVVGTSGSPDQRRVRDCLVLSLRTLAQARDDVLAGQTRVRWMNAQISPQTSATQFVHSPNWSKQLTSGQVSTFLEATLATRFSSFTARPCTYTR